MKILVIIKKMAAFLKKIIENSNNRPKYRVVKIFKDDNDNYKALLHVINKNTTFYAKPEELLADDNFVDCLSPRDVRTLTYLGYLSINQPQYKILAQRLSEKSEVFIMKRRGEKKSIVKTASEIAKDADIIASMDPSDAKIVGYAIANNELKLEEIQKNEIKKALKDNK